MRRFRFPFFVGMVSMVIYASDDDSMSDSILFVQYLSFGKLGFLLFTGSAFFFCHFLFFFFLGMGLDVLV